ncbi:DUF2147 domain-containing protein [soil metagenome]
MLRILFLFVTVTCFTSSTWVANDLTGVWLNKDKDSHIKIFASGGKFFGQIVWLKEPIDTVTKKPKLDKHNPDTKFQNRPVMNLIILKNLEFDVDDQEWSDGNVYDPKSGHDYSLTCKLKDKNTMELRGYMGISLLGRTDIWTRVIE